MSYILQIILRSMSYQMLKLLLALLLFPLAVITVAGSTQPAYAEARIGLVGVLEWNGENHLDEFVSILNTSEKHTIVLDGHTMDLDSWNGIGLFMPNGLKLKPCEYVYVNLPDYTISAFGASSVYLYDDDGYIADRVDYPYYDRESTDGSSLFEFGEEWLSEDDAGTCGNDELRGNAGKIDYGFCSDLMTDPASSCNTHNYLLPIEAGFDGEYVRYDYGLGVGEGSYFEIDYTYQDGAVPPIDRHVGSPSPSSPDPSNPSTATPQSADPAPAGPVAAEPVAADPAPAPIATPSPQSPPANSPMVLDPGNSAKDELIVHLQERNEDLEAENDSLRLILSDLLSYLGKMQETITGYGIHADSP